MRSVFVAAFVAAAVIITIYYGYSILFPVVRG